MTICENEHEKNLKHCFIHKKRLKYHFPDDIDQKNSTIGDFEIEFASNWYKPKIYVFRGSTGPGAAYFHRGNGKIPSRN